MPERGRRVGPYVVLEPLGAGTMSSVHVARDAFLDRVVALKIHGATRGSQSLRRFRQEARALATLVHPNVARTLDVGSDGEVHYHAMELVRGVTLRALAAETRLSWREAWTIARGIAAGLAAAHAAGVMHRDLKPSNVMIDRDGTVKLIDFGLAKQIDVDDGSDAQTVLDWQSVETSTGALLGTPAYMSPEQARGEEVDARSDVFAVGTLLFEMIARKSLFRRANPATTLQAIVQDPAPRLDAVAPSTPPWLADVVARALEKEPLLRFPDAGALLGALEGPALDAGAEPEVQLAPLVQHALGARGAGSSERTIPPSLPALARALLREPLFGREEALAQLEAWDARGGGALALVGPAGVGKTRLAAELACRARDGAVSWIELEHAEDAAGALTKIAQAMGLPSPGPEGGLLARHLARAEGELFVLDGWDALDALEREAFDAWLRALESRSSAGPRILVTTRERLGAGAADPLELAGLAAVPARALFETRIARLSAERGVDPAATALVLDLVRGHPLAIELLAGSLATVGEAAVVAELERSSTPAPLARALDVALALLPHRARERLVGLSIFETFDAASAASVLADGTEEELRATLEWLERAGLVRAIRHPELLAAARFRLDRSVAWRARELSRARGDRDALAARHAAHAAGLARDAVALLRSAPLRESWRELLAARADLAIVGRRALSTHDPLAIERALASLSAALFVGEERGASLEDEGLIDALIDAAEALGAPHPRTLAEARLARTDSLERVDPERAEDALARGIELALAAESASMEARLRARRALLRARHEQREGALRDAQRATSSADARRDAELLAGALFALAVARGAARDVDGAREALTLARELTRARSDEGGEARLAFLEAELEAEQGERARELEALDAARTSALVASNRRVVVEASLRSAITLREGDERARSLEHLHDAAQALRELHQPARLLPELRGRLLSLAAIFAVEEGASLRAAALAERAREHLGAISDATGEALARAILAAALARSGAFEQASTELTRATLAARSLDAKASGTIALVGVLLDVVAHPDPETLARAEERLRSAPSVSPLDSSALVHDTHRALRQVLSVLLLTAPHDDDERS